MQLEALNKKISHLAINESQRTLVSRVTTASVKSSRKKRTSIAPPSAFIETFLKVRFKEFLVLFHLYTRAVLLLNTFKTIQYF